MLYEKTDLSHHAVIVEEFHLTGLNFLGKWSRLGNPQGAEPDKISIYLVQHVCCSQGMFPPPEFPPKAWHNILRQGDGGLFNKTTRLDMFRRRTPFLHKTQHRIITALHAYMYAVQTRLAQHHQLLQSPPGQGSRPSVASYPTDSGNCLTQIMKNLCQILRPHNKAVGILQKNASFSEI